MDAVLVSVHRCGPEQMEVLGHLVREFPGIPTVALVSQHDPGAIEMLLRLGASGVRQVVDVTSPAGWSRLRQVVGQPATRAVARIQGPILEALAEAPPDARLFVEAMIRLAPEVPTVTAPGAAALGPAQHADVPLRAGGSPVAQELSGGHPAAPRRLPVRDRGTLGGRCGLSAGVLARPRASAGISGPCWG